MKRALLLLVSLSLLTVPAVAAGSSAEAACDPNNVEVQCVFWETMALIIPEKCVEANNFITCTIHTWSDDLPDPLA